MLVSLSERIEQTVMMLLSQYKYNPLLRLILLVFLMCFSAQEAQSALDSDKSSAVIFGYQNIGNDTVPESNIPVELFKDHIRELKTGGYNVLPLPKIISALSNGEELPPKTIALTFEGAYLTSKDNAFSLLLDEGLPFTVFFASDMADTGEPNHMTWKQIKSLAKNPLVSLGVLPSSYTRLTGLERQKSAALINKAIAGYRDEFGDAPKYFLYPYGDYSTELKNQVKDYAFAAAFGQQSGVAYAGSDFLALPRFMMTDNFGDAERFRLTANALPLPVSDVLPDSTVVTENQTSIGFTVTQDITNLSKLSCFVSDLGKADLKLLGSNRVEIRLPTSLLDHRTRINCTLPDTKQIPGLPERWRWFGMLLSLPNAGETPATADNDNQTEE